MKKIIVNISENTYEKLRFEAIQEKKGMTQVIKDRIFYKPFSPSVLESYENLIDAEFKKLTQE